MATQKQKGKLEESEIRNRRPAHEIRIGKIRCAIWANQTVEQGVWFSFTLSRSYKDGEQWKSAHSFGRDDALVLAEVSRQAFLWISKQQGSVGDEGKVEDLPGV